jgi:MoxR-like ATPase
MEVEMEIAGINNQIKNWVDDAIKKGYNNDELILLLSKEGYSRDEIEKILAVFNVKISQKNLHVDSERSEISDKKTKSKKGFLEKIIRKKEERQVSPEIKEVAEIISKIKKEVAKVIVGQEEVINGFICALLCDGHVLLEGVPGIAKTLIVKTLAEVSGCSSKRIQFTVDLLPSDIIGITTYSPKKGFETIRGPIFANFIIADEINRSPPKTQSALIEAMQEKQVTIGKETFKLPSPFFVMANNNPLETEGVYVLPEAQVDRFLFKLFIGYPKNKEEKEIMESNTTLKKFQDFNINPVLSPGKILEMQRITKGIYIDERVKDYIIKIVEKTRKRDFEKGKYIERGGSPRANIGIFIASKAWALMNGRDYVIPKDVKDVIHYVLRHRIILNYKAKAEKITSDDIIDEILGMVDI